MLSSQFVKQKLSKFSQAKDSVTEISRKQGAVLKEKLTQPIDTSSISGLINKLNFNTKSSDTVEQSKYHNEADIDKETENLTIAKDSLSYLLEDNRIPDSVKKSLEGDFVQVQKMLEKLQYEYIHIAVLGRVSVGKSSLLNALVDKEQCKEIFSVSPLHGETKTAAYHDWHEYKNGHVILIDTPGINEVEGKSRETLALDVVSRADVILFVVDGDMTQTEFDVLDKVSKGVQPIILVLNKADRYSHKDRQLLIEQLENHVSGLIKKEHIVTSASTTTVKTIIYVDENGKETETEQKQKIDVEQLKTLLLDLLSKEGKSIAALNATFFAGKLSEQVTAHLFDKQKQASADVIRMYCISKSLAVAVNPVPIVDLFSAALIDVGMILHLSKVYGLQMTKAESAELIRTIMSQLILLMGTIWLMYVISSALKLGSFGFSTILTATGEGAVAYYGTYVVGKAANLYFRQGKSWGEQGPKQAVKKILDGIDRDSIMQQAKADIMTKMNEKS